MGRNGLVKGFLLILFIVGVLCVLSFLVLSGEEDTQQWQAQREEYRRYTGYVSEKKIQNCSISLKDNWTEGVQRILALYDKKRDVHTRNISSKNISTQSNNISEELANTPNTTLKQPQTTKPLRHKFKLPKKNSRSVPGILNVHIWEGWCGSRIEDLKRNLHFPLFPSVKANLTRFFAQWYETGYGERIFGFLHPPETGNYTFAVSCDDNCEVWLSSSSLPAHISQIVSVGTAYRPANTRVADFKQYKTQISNQIYLVKGNRYYIEAVHKQAANKDHILLTWLAPSWPRIRTISSDYISSYISDADCSKDVNDYSQYIPETKACILNSSTVDENSIYWFNRSKFHFGIADLRDEFYYHNIMHDDFEDILSEVEYKPSYILDFVPKRYEGVKLVHEISVYPNDHTELTHMMSYEFCEFHRSVDSHYSLLRPTTKPTLFEPWKKFIEKQKNKNKRSHLIHESNNTVSRNTKNETTFVNNVKRNSTADHQKHNIHYGHTYLNKFISPNNSSTNHTFQDDDQKRREKQYSLQKHGLLVHNHLAVNENDVTDDSLQQTLPYENTQKVKFKAPNSLDKRVQNIAAKGYVRKGRQLFSFDIQEDTTHNINGSTRHKHNESYSDREVQHAMDKNEILEIKNKTTVSIRSNNQETDEKQIDGPLDSKPNGPSIFHSTIQKSYVKKKYVSFEDGLPANEMENFRRKRPIFIPDKLSSRLRELQDKLAHRNSMTPAKQVYTGSYTGYRRTHHGYLRRQRQVTLDGPVPPRITRKIFFLNGKPSMKNVSITYNTQLIRLYDIFGPAIYYLTQPMKRAFSWIYSSVLSDCKSDGNLRLSKEVAKVVVNQFMEAIKKKYGMKYGLKRIVNVEENHDVLKGNRYLLELELSVQDQDEIVRISKYVYQDLSLVNLYYPKDFQWNPHATVHIIVPVKDQGRWVQHFIDNMEKIYLERKDPHVNIIIVDFNSTDINIERSLKESKLKRYQLIYLDGPFQRALGIQAGADAIKNPGDIIFTCDLHLVIPSQLIDSIRKHTIKGKMAFAPMVHRLSCGYTPELPYGVWEIQGFGLFSISKFDYDRIGGMNTKEFKTKWGGEDWEFLDRTLAHGLEVERLRIPKFYHYFHSKKRMWLTPSVSSLKQEYNL